MRFLIKVIINAVGLWLVTLILAPHVTMTAFPPADAIWTQVLTYLLVALVFGVVNAVIGNAIRIVAFPVYVLTLGLVSLLVNGLLILLVAWLSTLIGFGLSIETFWWGVLAALILGVISWVLGLIFRPILKREGRNH